MGTRILIYIAGPPQADPELPAAAKDLLERAGATEIRASHSELPGLLTAVVPASANIPELLEKLKQTPGVKHAETDELRWAQ